METRVNTIDKLPKYMLDYEVDKDYLKYELKYLMEDGKKKRTFLAMRK